MRSYSANEVISLPRYVPAAAWVSICICRLTRESSGISSGMRQFWAEE